MRKASGESSPATGRSKAASDNGAARRSGQGRAEPRGPGAASAKLAKAAASAPAPQQQFDWIEQHMAQADTIKAVRSVSRTEPAAGVVAAASVSGSAVRSRAQTPSSSAGEAQLWSDDNAATIIESNLKSPGVKIQLLTRALEESRLKLQTLLQERQAAADAVLRLCELAGMGMEAAAGWEQATGSAEQGPQQRLELLRAQVQGLQEQLRSKAGALQEAEEQHGVIALRLVGQQQELEAAEQQLSEARHAIHMHEQAQAALQLKLGLLEGQLAAESSSARKRMEEQLDSFRGEAETARTLRGRFADVQLKLELALRMHRDEAERAVLLSSQADSLRVQLKEANARSAQLSQQLLDKTAALNHLDAQQREAAEGNRQLAAANKGLRTALADHKERALLADSLQARLAVAQEEARLAQAELQEENSRLRDELRAEREHGVAVQAQLTDERLATQSLRAALQARDDEIASLLLRLDEYSSRVVATADAVQAAQQQAQQAGGRRAQAEAVAGQQRHEIETLQTSLAELAASELDAKHRMQEAQTQLAAQSSDLTSMQQQCASLQENLAGSRQLASELQQTIAQQARQLEGMARLQQQSLRQEAEVASLTERLQHESHCCAQLKQRLAELQAAKTQADEELRKQTAVSDHCRQQATDLGRQLEVATAELKAAQREAREVKGAAEQAAQAHETELAALEGVHAGRKRRNEQLEHDNKQQAVIIARLEKSNASLASRLAAEQARAEALRGYALAHSQAYGRLAGHSRALQEQFNRQLAALLHLCRHSSLQLEAALAAADPLAALQGEQRVVHPPAVKAALDGLDGLRLELCVAAAMLEAQTSGEESRSLAELPQGIESSLQLELAGLPRGLPLQPGRSTRSPAGGPVQEPAASAPTDASAAEAERGGPEAVPAQVAAMEGQLEAVLHANTELRARAAAAEALQQQEQGTRQRAQDLAATLTADLTASQKQLGVTEAQRADLERRCTELGQQLRDAIYTISQMTAAQQGQAISWALRGLHSQGTQTQYCILWERTLGDTNTASCGAQDQGQRPEAEDSAGAVQEAAADAPGSMEGGGSRQARPLPLVDLRRLIADIYRAKAVNDIAVARGQQPFQPLAAFLGTYLAQQHGADTVAAQQRSEQLRLGVEALAGSAADVALFGLSSGLLEEGTGGQLISRHNRGSTSAEGAAVPLVLYASQRRRPEAKGQADVLASLRGFCHSQWHAAYLASCSHRLPAAFQPADALHSICWEVQALVAGVPGAEVLLRWVAAGGAGAWLGQVDLGVQVAENQVPQLYLLAVDAARQLGISTTPRLHVLNSGEAAVHYLQVPKGCPAFHGFCGSLASTNSSSSSGSSASELVAGAGAVVSSRTSSGSSMEWECALVLTSRLVDLLEPAELQAVMAGCMGLHVALEPKPTVSSSSSSSSDASASTGSTPAATKPSTKDQAAAAALCRGLAAIHTLASLAALAPEVLLRQLPHQAAPLFHSRLQPVLLCARRYLAFLLDCASLAVAGDLSVVAAALVKLASGSTVLRNELAIDAVIAQAQALDDVTAAALPKLLWREDPAALAAAGNSLTVLRIKELLRWSQQQGRAVASPASCTNS